MLENLESPEFGIRAGEKPLTYVRGS